MSISSDIEKTQYVMLIALMCVIGIVFFPSFGTTDMALWISWANKAEKLGLVAGYAATEDQYPPLTVATLWGICKITNIIHLPNFYAIKLSIYSFLLATIFLLYRLFNRNIVFTVAIGLYLLRSSMSLSYLDVYFAPFLLLSLRYLSVFDFQKGVFLFVLSALFKFQPLIIAPFLFFWIVYTEYVKNKGDLYGLFRGVLNIALPSLLLLFVILIVFGNAFVSSFVRAFGEPGLSDYALNFNWIQTRVIQILFSGSDFASAYNNDASIMYSIPKAALWIARSGFLLSYFSVIYWWVFKRKTVENFLLACFLGSLSYFMFATGVHENHMFLSILIAVFLYSLNTKYQFLAVNAILIGGMNLFVFYGYNGELAHIWPLEIPRSGWVGKDAWRNGGPPIDYRLMLAVFNVLWYMVLNVAMWRKQDSDELHNAQTIKS